MPYATEKIIESKSFDAWLTKNSMKNRTLFCGKAPLFASPPFSLSNFVIRRSDISFDSLRSLI